MWNDLIRRWLDMAFWWLPGQNTPQERPRQREQASTPPPREQAEKSSRPEQADAPAPGAQAEAPREASEPRPEPAAPAQGPATPEPAPAASEPEDLTQIKGIGAAMQQRLNAHGIRSFRDLAGADAERLLHQLKEDKAVISEARVKAWIQAAQERVRG